ncbi:MAG: glutaredoxin family protein [Deltaproteobacteria bacterium]|nr:glutaredoxin family protein [Deltaproteobacteria bacterium]
MRKIGRSILIGLGFLCLSFLLPPAPTRLEAKPERKPVVLFGASWCGACRAAEAFLRRVRVPFAYRDVDQPEVRTEFRRVAGERKGIPVIVVGDEQMLGANLTVLATLLERGGYTLPKAPTPDAKTAEAGGYGGHTAAWWQAQFRNVRTKIERKTDDIERFSKVAADNIETEVLERMKEDLEILEQTLNLLETDASSVSLPRSYRE